MSNAKLTNSSSKKSQQQCLRRITVGALPLMHHVVERMQLPQILSKYISKHGNDRIDPVDSLLLIIYNLSLGKIPLYELDQWCNAIDLTRIGVTIPLSKAKHLNDDRFGKALDKLYFADRSSLLTEIVSSYIVEFDLELNQLHNDSTTIKAFGAIPGKTHSGLELKHGLSKDHRPDLKQLVFNLSISADGAVPIHHRCLPGNYTDDKTHIDTWNTLRFISRRVDFIYVGDSKLCTDEQLQYIVNNGGRAITVMPDTWNEAKSFKEKLKITSKQKRIIWRRQKPNNEKETEYFSTFSGEHTTKQGYKIHWIYSSEKKRRDRKCRESILKKAEYELSILNSKLNTRKLTTKESIASAVKDILRKNELAQLINYEIDATKHRYREQAGKGRPSKNTKYRIVIETHYELSWSRDRDEIKSNARLDGIFPLVSTDAKLSAKQTLKAYKYQPRLEKRFAQFKSIHNAAPLLFKKIERVEANMFAFFISLVIQSLIERQVRNNMKNRSIEKIYIYPEERKCKRPTSAIIFERFEQVSRYELTYKDTIIEQYRDTLNKPQKDILDVFGMTEMEYWM